MDNRRRQSGESQARHPAAGCFGIRPFSISGSSFGPPFLLGWKWQHSLPPLREASLHGACLSDEPAQQTPVARFIAHSASHDARMHACLTG